MDKHSLLVGLDLGERVTQLSCFDRKLFEPVPIGRERVAVKSGNMRFLLRWWQFRLWVSGGM